jgi:hypothetical protein
VVDILRTTCAPDLVPDVVSYFRERKLWPLPKGCTLRAHVGVRYFDHRVPVGKFPAIVAPLHDINGELVTCQVTYVKDGWKLRDHEPRKTLSGTTGREGVAVRLLPLDGPVLAVGEGLETCLAYHRLNRHPDMVMPQHGAPGPLAAAGRSRADHRRRRQR